MRYDEWIHGMYRDTSFKPSTLDVRENKRAYSRQRQEVLPSASMTSVAFFSAIACIVVFAILFKVHQESIALILAGVIAIVVTIISIKHRTQPFFPKPEKSPWCNGIIIIVAALIVIVYNILCLIGVVGGDADNGSALGIFIGWIGLSYLVTQVFYGIKMNTKCTESEEAVCIGYADKIKSGGENHMDHVSSRCVYEFSYDGKTFVVPDHKVSIHQSWLRGIGGRKLVRFDPDNPEFCMMKKVEIAAFVKGIIVGGLCLLFCIFVVRANIINKDDNDRPATSGTYVVDENGNIVPVEYTTPATETTIETTEATVETTAETEPVISGYTDEMLSEMFGTDEFVVITTPVVSIEGEYAYTGQIPGVMFDIIDSSDVEVNDRIMYVIRRDATVSYFVLNDDENYLGDHTPENYGYVAEDGRHILTEEYKDFFFGTNVTFTEYTYAGIEDNMYTFESTDYIIQYDITPGGGMYYWDLEIGDKFYVFENSQHSFIVSSDLYVFPN